MNTNSTPTKSSIAECTEKQTVIQPIVIAGPHIQVSCEHLTGAAIVTLSSDTPFEAHVIDNQQRLLSMRLSHLAISGGHCVRIVLWSDQYVVVQEVA